MICPSQIELRDWVLGAVVDARIDSISDHLSSCTTCSNFVETLDTECDALMLAARNQDVESAVSDSFQQMMQNMSPQLHRTDDLIRVLEAGQVRDYQLIEPIGRGGMGAVYRATHTRLKKTVAP